MKKLFLLSALLTLPAVASANTDRFAGAFAHPHIPDTRGATALACTPGKVGTCSADTGFVLSAEPDPQAGSGHSVALTCTAGTAGANQDPATSFNFKRSSTTGGPYTTIGNAPTCSFTDLTVSAGQKWFYVATGMNAGGESAPSNEVSATVPTFPPPTPGPLSATPK